MIRVLFQSAAIAVATVLAVAVLVLGWFQFAGVSTPSCSWPMRVRGQASGEQAGLLRCYLRALAQHDSVGLIIVAGDYAAPVRITPRDFAHSADARAGTATATFTRNQFDDTYTVQITFADQNRETVLMALTDPAGHSWHLAIGTTARHQPPGPPPTVP
jgi:hypothetical protein